MSGCGGDDDGVSCNGLLKVIVNEVTVSKCGEATGRIEVSGSGGQGNVEFSIDGVNFQSSGVFENLTKNKYLIRIMDANGCSAVSDSVDVNDDNALAINTVSVTGSQGCFESMGSITVSGAGGSGTYTYSIDGGTAQSSGTFNNLTAGEHEVTLIDGNCNTTQQVLIPSGVSYKDTIEPIFQTNCNTSNCHNGDRSNLPNFNNFSEVVNKAAEIKKRTADKSMPVNGSLTDQEIQLIACWINDGAKDN
jgi:hypothetical protein